MRDNEQGPQGFSQGDVFTELTDLLRVADDAGMTAYEANLRVVHKYITDDFITPKKPIDHKELADIDQDLHDTWLHEGDMAQVSGRLYLYDPDIEDFIPPEWGEGILDENDEIYYLVEGVRLRSVTAETAVKFDDTGLVADVKMAYTFALPDDEDEMPVFCAYLGELYEHRYDQPTPQEAITRLENEWPRQFIFIREWLEADTKTQLPHRLQYITHELQDDLANSEQFRQLFERYIQFFVTLDQTLPYGITVKGTLDYFDGEANPFNDEVKGEWLAFTVDGELSILGYYPKIQVKQRSDGTVHCTMIVATFNAKDGDKAEYIRLDIDTMKTLRSTRAISSLLSKAIFEGARGSIIEAVPADGEYELNPIDSRDEVDIDVGPREERVIEKIPESIRELMAIEEVINKVGKLVKLRQAVLYSTVEEAERAAENLINDEIYPMFIQIKRLSNLECSISGPGIVVAKGKSGFVGGEGTDAPLQFIYTNDKDSPASPLLPGDSYTGRLLKFAPAAGLVADENGNEPKYYAQPSLAMSVDRASYVPIAVSGTPLVNIDVDMRALVPLDGKAEIKLKVLEDFRDIQAILAKLDAEYAGSRVLHLVKTLHESLINNERPDAYVDFEETELFSSLENLSDNESLLSGAVELLEKLLVGRTLQLSGEVIVKTADHTYIDIEALKNKAVVSGAIVDIRTDIRGNDVYLAIAGAKGVVTYVLARSITKFMF